MAGYSIDASCFICLCSVVDACWVGLLPIRHLPQHAETCSKMHQCCNQSQSTWVACHVGSVMRMLAWLPYKPSSGCCCCCIALRCRHLNALDIKLYEHAKQLVQKRQQALESAGKLKKLQALAVPDTEEKASATPKTGTCVCKSVR